MNLFFYVTKHKSILNFIDPDWTIYVQMTIGAILITIVCDQALQWLRRRGGYPIYRKTTIVFGFLFTNLSVYFLWLLCESGRQAFELFFYNLMMPVNAEAANFMTFMSGLAFMMILLSSCFFIVMAKPGIWKPHHQAPKTKKVIMASVCLPVSLCFISLYYPIYSFHLDQAYEYLFEKNTFIEEHYIHPAEVKLTWPKKKQNLLYIFVESFEASSFSKELGGLNDENLLPHLTEWMYQGTTFSNHSHLFGGAMTMPQATVTMSGMATALTGVNYKIPIGVANDDPAVTIPSIIALNDLLKEQGYEQYLLSGASVDDYNIGKFYRAHGDATTVGYKEKIESGDLPKDYKVWWGYEDSKLFAFAKQDLEQLQKKDVPFLYTINTTNTHRTDGYTEEFCSVDYEYPMQNALACEDQMLSEFLDWAKSQPFYEHTTIVVVGDHLGHEEAYTKAILNPQEDRRIFNLILNEQSPIHDGDTYNRQFFAGDMFPTVLSALGVKIEGNRLGLGTNLFSKEPTLIDQYSAEVVTDALSKNSVFYTETFLKPKEK